MTSEYSPMLLDVNWKSYYGHLKGVAHRAISSRIYNGNVGSYIDADDIALGVIHDVRSGLITWNAEKYPNLLLFLALVVRSRVSKFAALKDNELTVRSPEGLDEETIVAEQFSVEEKVEDLEFIVDFTDYIETSDEKETSKELVRVIRLMEEGYKGEALALKLGITPSKVNNYRKVLSRRLRDFYLAKYGELPKKVELILNRQI